MRTSFVILLIVAAFAAVLPATAQDETPQVELYGGYYYARFNVSVNAPGFPAAASFNANGGGGQLEYNVTRWLGIVGDLGGYHVSTPSGAGAFSYLFGPRINFRRKRTTVMPFAHVLFGGVDTTGSIGRVGPTNAFAMTVGGGVDIAVSPSVAIRPAQAEYFMTKFSGGLGNRQDNFRFGAGVVFRFGQK